MRTLVVYGYLFGSVVVTRITLLYSLDNLVTRDDGDESTKGISWDLYSYRKYIDLLSGSTDTRLQVVFYV